MTIAVGIELPEAEIADICRRHQVKELSLFGSAARGEMRPDSDVDLLVDFLPGARPGLLGVSAMMREFTALLGRRVDLAVKPAQKPLIRPGVLAEARLIYSARSVAIFGKIAISRLTIISLRETIISGAVTRRLIADCRDRPKKLHPASSSGDVCARATS
jgi:hypothetical protein